MDITRRGIVLPVTLAIAVLLGIMGGSVWMLSRQTYREVEKLDGFLRAVSVGEACFSHLMQRLESKPWEERWFKTEPDQGSGSWLDGTYEYLISDAELPNQADLLVRATWSQTSISMYWLVRAEPDSLSPHRRMKVAHFAHAVGDPDVSYSALDALRDVARDGEAQREANREWADSREGEIQSATGGASIVRAIGGVGDDVVDQMPRSTVPPPGGGAGPRVPTPQVPPPPQRRSQPAEPMTLDTLTLCREELRAAKANMPYLQSAVSGAQQTISTSQGKFDQYKKSCEDWRRKKKEYEECQACPPDASGSKPTCTPPGEEPAGDGGCDEAKVAQCEARMNDLNTHSAPLQSSSNELLGCSIQVDTSISVIDSLASSSKLVAQSTAQSNLEQCKEANTCASPSGMRVWTIRNEVYDVQQDAAELDACMGGGGG